MDNSILYNDVERMDIDVSYLKFIIFYLEFLEFTK